MARRETSNPASELWQADVPGTGLGPNDSWIDDGNIPPTIDCSAPLADGVEGQSSPVPPPPPGSIANHVQISDPDGNSLSGGNYSMLGIKR
jgi:hypothetical protein